jgi:hypothetical protein
MRLGGYGQGVCPHLVDNASTLHHSLRSGQYHVHPANNACSLKPDLEVILKLRLSFEVSAHELNLQVSANEGYSFHKKMLAQQFENAIRCQTQVYACFT